MSPESKGWLPFEVDQGKQAEVGVQDRSDDLWFTHKWRDLPRLFLIYLILGVKGYLGVRGHSLVKEPLPSVPRTQKAMHTFPPVSLGFLIGEVCAVEEGLLSADPLSMSTIHLCICSKLFFLSSYFPLCHLSRLFFTPHKFPWTRKLEFSWRKFLSSQVVSQTPHPLQLSFHFADLHQGTQF